MKAHGHDAEAWEAIRPKAASRWWRVVKKRSPFNFAHTEQIFTIAREGGWELTDEFRKVVAEHWGGITNTKLIEDGVRDLRAAGEKPSFNKAMAGATAWSTLADCRTDSTKHRFSRVPHECTVVPRAHKDDSVRSLFRVRPKAVPKAYADMVTAERTAPYFSPSPLHAGR